MALIFDTGVLYAALDRADSDHAVCRGLIETTTEQMVIPSPTLVEIDYLLSKANGAPVMLSLLRDIRRGVFEVAELEYEDYERVGELLDRYADQEIGFVDAAVLAIVERFREPKLATLDKRHFAILRPRHVEALTLLPARSRRRRS